MIETLVPATESTGVAHSAGVAHGQSIRTKLAVGAPITLSPAPTRPGPLTRLALHWMPDDVSQALALGVRLGTQHPSPGDGGTRDLWEALATVAAHDLGAARAIEPHLDAIAILAQAARVGVDGDAPRTTALGSARGRNPDTTWGVYASEGGDAPLTATEGPDPHGFGSAGGRWLLGSPRQPSTHWLLSGTKQWCSLADRLHGALVTAAVSPLSAGAPGGIPQLFSVDLNHPGIIVDDTAWVARGLAEIPSGPVHFDDVPARAVGAPGWYLSRPGFAWGGIGVAACWFGGAVGVARTVFAAAEHPNPFVLAHLGAIDELLQSARRALLEAATLVDLASTASGAASGGGGVHDGAILAKRVRATVVRACEGILHHAAHALGPGPLAQDERHAKRVADLHLYIRQHHAERDQASLGAALLRASDARAGDPRTFGASIDARGNAPW